MSSSIFDPQNTIVIADFDGTFTKKEILGKKTSSLMTVLVSEKYLGEQGTKECQALFSEYYPIEIDPNLSRDEKAPLMYEWWTKTTNVLKNAGITTKMLEEVCNSPLLELREGLLDFLNLLKSQKIPLIVYSAGNFGQFAIEYILSRMNLLSSNVQVISNRLVFDDQDRLVEIVEPIIHITNKTGDILVKNGLISAKPKRRQCLLIGDTLEDDQMANGLDFDFVYKVAFAGYNGEHFRERFNLVLDKDAGYKQITSLF